MKVMYVAPKGDAEVVTFMGVKFFEGQAVTVDDPLVLAKALKNPHFVVGDDDEADPEPEKRGPGRPRKQD